MNIDLRKKQKIILKIKKKVDQLCRFSKKSGNVRKHGHVKVVTFEKIKNCLVSEPNHHTANFFLKIY